MNTVRFDTLEQYKNKEITLFGWVHKIREMGKIVFLDIRNAEGVMQMVVDESVAKEAYVTAKALKRESVIEIRGTLCARPEKLVNKKIKSGEFELQISAIVVLNLSKDTPLDVSKDTREVHEEVRLKYRYLDLRSERMHRNIAMRSKTIHFIRNYLIDQNFYEIETPMLTKGTPEGAREFIVPSRIYSGKFYVLPQSPQQLKQLLMVAGFERYFQIARCFRDEDTRGDRQPEFTQLDLEMSFAAQKNVIHLTESLVIELVKKIFPDKKIQATPFPRMSWDEAQKKYKSDKPDLRKDKKDEHTLAFLWVTDFPLFEKSETDKKLVSSHHPFTAPKGEDAKLLNTKPENIRAEAYDLVLNGFEIGGGSIRIHNAELQKKIFEILGLSADEVKEKFGHMLEAFEFGAPPHGGIALGLDRLFAILLGEPNIREVIAFPKTGDAKDLMMGAPSPLPEKTLKEANITTLKKNNRESF